MSGKAKTGKAKAVKSSEVISRREGKIVAIVPVTLDEFERLHSATKCDDVFDLYAERAGLDMKDQPDDWSVSRSVAGYRNPGPNDMGTVLVRVEVTWTPRGGAEMNDKATTHDLCEFLCRVENSVNDMVGALSPSCRLSFPGKTDDKLKPLLKGRGSDFIHMRGEVTVGDGNDRRLMGIEIHPTHGEVQSDWMHLSHARSAGKQTLSA